MRTLIALTIAAASFAYGSVPALNVTVADSSGKTAFKGATNAKGAFATGMLKPGAYSVQFNSSSAPSGTYALVVSAGSKKVTASAVSGAKFAKGGVAMKIDVGSGVNGRQEQRAARKERKADGMDSEEGRQQSCPALGGS